MPATNPPNRGRGRPRKEPTENKTFRLPQSLAEYVDARCDAKGQTISEYLRRLILADQKAVEGGRKAAAEK